MTIMEQFPKPRNARVGFEARALLRMARLAQQASRVTTFGREFVLVLLAYLAYFTVRGLTQGSDERAVAHAHNIVSFERSAGFFWEPAIQAHLVGQHWIVTAANWMYIWGHWPLIGMVAAWLFVRRPETYRLFRNAFFISGLIGIVIFVLYPVAPPRLADVGVVDTVTLYSNSYRLLQPPAFVNQYAAVPSLHFGWDLLIGIALVRQARWLALKAAGVIVPVLMCAAIVITANHYIFDAFAGGVVALIGLALSYAFEKNRSRLSSARRIAAPAASRIIFGRGAYAR